MAYVNLKLTSCGASPVEVSVDFAVRARQNAGERDNRA